MIPLEQTSSAVFDFAIVYFTAPPRIKGKEMESDFIHVGTQDHYMFDNRRVSVFRSVIRDWDTGQARMTVSCVAGPIATRQVHCFATLDDIKRIGIFAANELSRFESGTTTEAQMETALTDELRRINEQFGANGAA